MAKRIDVDRAIRLVNRGAVLIDVLPAKVFVQIGTDVVPSEIVCATGSEPVVVAIDRFVGAGFGVVYLHQIGPDQQRLVDMSERELLPHYAGGRR